MNQKPQNKNGIGEWVGGLTGAGIAFIGVLFGPAGFIFAVVLGVTIGWIIAALFERRWMAD